MTGTPSEPTLVLLGRVTGVHGLRGDLRVRPESSDGSALLELEHLLLRPPGSDTPSRYKVTRAVARRGVMQIHLKGIDRIEMAEALVGGELLTTADALPELDEDEYYWHELDGMQVIDVQRGELGTIVDLLPTGAHDVYVVQGPLGEILIPAVEVFVLEIDRQQRLMRVDLPDGLIDHDAL